VDADGLAERIIKIIAVTKEMSESELSIDSTFEELGFDSVDGVNIAFALEDEFDIEIPDDAVREIRGVRQIADSIRPLLAERGAG
jgi:acyl carrier protein